MKMIPSPLLTRAALLCAAVFLLLTVPGQAQLQSLLTRHVRNEVVNGQAQFVGHLPANETLRFDIVLPLRDRAGRGLAPARKIGMPWLLSRKQTALKSSTGPARNGT
jgi:hypothetical protein